jgi:hypothetical protein
MLTQIIDADRFQKEGRAVSTLVVVACGAKKIWDLNRTVGSTPAKDAYVGTLFRLSRKYAERFADSWIVLSAKYGYAEPDFVIGSAYDVTFNKRSTNPVQVETLREQAKKMHLDRFNQIVVLGGARYVKMVRASLAGSKTEVSAPLKGLGIGLMQSCLKQAIQTGVQL